jgi:uncharacterized protein DUF4255/carboxypeptidase family protein
MFQDLDTALTNLLHDPAAPADVRNADISFETPDKNFTPADGTVNLFLFDLKENRELRDPEPIREIIAGVVVRRQPPLRTDCTYLVTAWANNLAGPARVAGEHSLLGQTLVWLSRFPIVPAAFFVGGGLANPPFPPPTMVAQAKADNSAGEFWSALGIPPRPAFYLTVTIALELGMQTIEGPPVVTKEIILSEIPTPIVATWFEIGGTVRDSSTLLPVEAAEVTLVETGAISVTDEQGHFRFSNLEAGNYTLHVVAAGFAPQDKPVVVPGLVLNEYDVAL